MKLFFKKFNKNFKLQNSSQAHFLKRLSQADEPRMSEKSADFYATVQKVVPRKSFVIHDKNFLQQNFFKKIRGGFTLIETLIAIMIFTTSVLALMSILSTSISDINTIKRKVIASYLAQEGIEYIRNMRDTYLFYQDNGWAGFKGKILQCTISEPCNFDDSKPKIDSTSIFLCSTYPSSCKLYVDKGNYNVNSIGKDSGFTRKIKVFEINENEIKVISTISWNSGAKEISFSQNLFNWVEAGISSSPPPPNNVVATGGIITDIVDNGFKYKVHTFKSSGDFTVTNGGEAEYLVVAGGGGGGSNNQTIGSGGSGIVIIRYKFQ